MSDRTLILALRSRVTEYLILSLQAGFSGPVRCAGRDPLGNFAF